MALPALQGRLCLFGVPLSHRSCCRAPSHPWLAAGTPCPLGLSQPLALGKHHLAKSPAREQKQRAPGRARELGEGAGPCTAPLQSWKPAGHGREPSPRCLCHSWCCPVSFRGALVALRLGAKGKRGVPASPPGKANSSSFFAGGTCFFNPSGASWPALCPGHGSWALPSQCCQESGIQSFSLSQLFGTCFSSPLFCV